MFEHPKIVKLSDGAFRLHLSGIGYCNRYLTDGIIHADVVSRLMPRFRRAYLDELLGGNNGTKPLWLLVSIPAGNHYEICDFLQWNSSRAEVENRRQARAAAGRKAARTRWDER